jgi:hypothetical protein
MSGSDIALPNPSILSPLQYNVVQRDTKKLMERGLSDYDGIHPAHAPRRRSNVVTVHHGVRQQL